MEDTHTVLPSLATSGLPDHSFVAAYNGHGGDMTALIAAKEMWRCVEKQATFVTYLAMQPDGRGRPAGQSSQWPPILCC